MAGQPPKMSQAVLDLLRQVKNEGSVDLLLHELERESLGFDWIPGDDEAPTPGAMADSTKRPLAPEGEAQGPLSQMPMVVYKTGSAGSEGLPQGVSDFEQWGRTLIESGKYHKCDVSYYELAVSTEKDKMA